MQLLPLCRVSIEQPLLEPADFVTSFKLLHATDSRAAMLNGKPLPVCLSGIFNGAGATCHGSLGANKFL